MTWVLVADAPASQRIYISNLALRFEPKRKLEANRSGMARLTGGSSNLSVDAYALFRTLEDRNNELQRQTPDLWEPSP